MTRVTNLAQHDRMISLIMQTQSDADNVQQQISSGKKSQTYQGIATDASRLVDLEVTHSRVDQYVKNNGQVDDRLQLMESNTGQIGDILSNFKGLLVNALNQGNAAELDLPTNASEMLKQVASLLNANLDGRHLFAGTMTDTTPVDLSALPASYTIPTVTGASSSYYQGDSTKLTVRADDNLDLQYGITADSQGFEEAIRALDVVVKGAPTDTTMLNHALDVVNSAISDVANIRTQIGNTRSTIAQIDKSHSNFQQFADQTIGDLENTDVTEAITRLNSAQTTLQASYMTLSALGKMNLMQFM